MDYLQFINFPYAVTHVAKLDGYGSINYKVSLENGAEFLVKINPSSEKKRLKEEERIITILSDHTDIGMSEAAEINLLPEIPNDIYIRVCNFIKGIPLTKETATDVVLAEIAHAAGSMVHVLQGVQSEIIKAHKHDWNLRDALRNLPKMQFITDPHDKKIVNYFFSCFALDVIPAFPNLRHSIIHGDLNEANIIINDGKVNGFIDFGDVSYAPTVCELAILLTYVMMMFPEECFEKASIVIQHFHRKFPLTEDEIGILPLLIATRLCVSVCNSAEAKATKMDTDYILVSEKPAWHLLHRWVATNPKYISNVFRVAIGLPIDREESIDLLERRRQVSAPSMGLSYSTPIHMQSALFQYMYDATGACYLDAYNNIPHVGHCHPDISQAALKQMRKLNTNTRYLVGSYVEYSELLLSLFPLVFDKVMLVNSGSEASDLATRMARTVSGRQGIAVLQWSYHGNTQNGINISSYKFDRKGGKGPEDWILRLPLPKAYNGKHGTATQYFNEAKTIIENFEANSTKLAAFIAEPISGCGGQVPIMDGYLKLLVPFLKSKGILIIIDEVQTGFGRLGNWFWGFEMHGIVPDMVILGKPIGNGHPMGAVVTTAEITDAFHNGMEFFSSFGGNPVSCEIGKAVINTIKQENLQANALQVGQYWKDELNKIKTEFPLLGDVRGAGLFIGVECIDDNGNENKALAHMIVNGLKGKYILTSTDGPLDNVLKMKPPLCFSHDNVDWHITELFYILKKHFQA